MKGRGKLNPGGPTVPPGKPDPTPEEPGAGKVRLSALRGRKGARVAEVLGGRLRGLTKPASDSKGE